MKALQVYIDFNHVLILCKSLSSFAGFGEAGGLICKFYLPFFQEPFSQK